MKIRISKILLLFFCLFLLTANVFGQSATNTEISSGVSAFINIMFYISYFLMVIVLLATVAGFVMNAITNPGSIMLTALGLGGFVVLFLIGFFISGNEIIPVYTKMIPGMSGSFSKVIGGSLIMSYLMLVLSFGGIVYSEVVKLFK